MLRPGKDKGLATPIPLGLAALATTTFLIGVAVIARSPAGLGPYVVQALLFGGLVELLAGMWAFAYGDALAATTFSFLGAFFAWWGLTQVSALHVAAAAGMSGMATIFVVMGVLVLLMWVASFYESAAFNLVLLFLWISMGLIGIGMFAGMEGLIVLGGISALISGLIAAYASFAEVYNATSLTEAMSTGAPRAMRERSEHEETERIHRLHPSNGMHQSSQMRA
jgi:succinate-acetate transporter protein